MGTGRRRCGDCNSRGLGLVEFLNPNIVSAVCAVLLNVERGYWTQNNVSHLLAIQSQT